MADDSFQVTVTAVSSISAGCREATSSGGEDEVHVAYGYSYGEVTDVAYGERYAACSSST